MNFSDFYKWDFKYTFQINTEFDVYKEDREDLTVITIDNFFKDPQAVVECLKQFPINDRDRFYEELADQDKFLLKPPGYQQVFPASYFEGISYILYKTLYEYDFVPHDYEANQEFQKLGDQINQFSYGTDILTPKMKNVMNNYMPHFDHTKFSFEVFLSEEEISGGTSFYKLKHKDQEYSSIDSLVDVTEEEDRIEIRDLLNGMNEITDSSPEYYTSFEENNIFKKYYTVPFEFNKLVIYKGTYWHSIDYDSAKEENLRYSLTSSYTPTNDEEDFD